jgi:ATP-dependent helicase IRC3
MKLTTLLHHRMGICCSFAFTHKVASYRRLLAHFNSGVRHPDREFTSQQLSHDVPIIGFSATFSRHDGLSLGSVFQEIVYHRDFLTMIREQWYCVFESDGMTHL